MLKKTLTNTLVLIFVLSVGIIAGSCASSPGSGGAGSGPVLGTPTPLQQILNALPAVPIPGNTLKFEFGGEAWIAKRNGADFFGGSVTFQTTSEGVILSLKQTHLYTRFGWIPTPGPEINLEYIAGPPSSFSSLSASEAADKIAEAQAAGLPSSESMAQAGEATLDIAIDMEDYTGELPEDLMKLDEAIARAARDVEQALPQGTVVAVLNFASNSKMFSDYVLEELTGELVSGRRVAFVDRVNQAFITQEMNLQTFGNIADDRLQGIGRTLGAKSVVSGSLTNMGAYYRFRVRVINVENAEIQAQVSLNLQNDTQVASLMRSGQPTVVAAATTTKVPSPTYITLPDVEWSSYTWENNSTAKFSINREQIDGQEKEVLSVEVDLPRVNQWGRGGGGAIQTEDAALVQQLREGYGIRFKVLGDGKPWTFIMYTSEVDVQTIITPSKEGVSTQINIPYSLLNTPTRARAEWDKKNISGFSIQRSRESNEVSNITTLKIYDLEIYEDADAAAEDSRQPTKTANAKNNWVSGEFHVGFLGVSARYERMLGPKTSLGTSISWLTGDWYETNDYGVETSFRFYPWGKTFFLGVGLGYHYFIDTDRYYYSLFGITPEIGWKLDPGNAGGIFVQPGIRATLAPTYHDFVLGLLSLSVYFGMGYAF